MLTDLLGTHTEIPLQADHGIASSGLPKSGLLLFKKVMYIEISFSSDHWLDLISQSLLIE